jgi:hypothetical protein
MRFCRPMPCVKCPWTGSDLAERLDRDQQNLDNPHSVDAAAALVREHHFLAAARRANLQLSAAWRPYGSPLNAASAESRRHRGRLDLLMDADRREQIHSANFCPRRAEASLWLTE